MTYARLKEDSTFQYPSPDEFRGIPNWSAHDALLRSRRYLPLKGTPEPPEGCGSTPVRGHVVEPAGSLPYIWVDEWEYTPEPEPDPEPPEPPVKPVVEYSKYKIKLACERLGLWGQVKEAIEAAGKWESFLLIQPLSSDNAELEEALPDIRRAFGDELVDRVLAESVVD